MKKTVWLWLLCAAGFLVLIVTAFSSCALDGPQDRDRQVGSNSPGLQNELSDADLEGVLAAGLIGSKHDFTQSLEHPRDLCTPCHVPHIAADKAPLLDKRPEAMERLRPYEAVGIELDSTSLLCLSCHDGVIASDVYTASHATQWVRALGSTRLGIAGATGHPIGVKYPVSAPTYHSLPAVTSGERIKLPDGHVQCISCHDPHNTGRHPGMLVQSNAGSRLCLACHRL